MIGMLVLGQAGREHDAGLQSRRMMAASLMAWAERGTLQMRVAIELDKLNRRAQQCRGIFGLADSLLWRAVSSRFAARTDDKMNFAPTRRFHGDDTAAPEFNVVGMRAEHEERREFSGRVRSRLHRDSVTSS